MKERTTIQQALATWWATELGQQLLSYEQHFLSQCLAQMFGYRMLIIADEHFAELTNQSRMQQCERLDFSQQILHGHDVDVYDAIIVPQLVSYLADPTDLLQSLWRLLKPNGQLLITGYSFRSKLGLQKWFRLKQTGLLPKRFYNRARLRRCLKRCDFNVALEHKYDHKIMQQGDQQAYSAWFGPLYCLVADKKLVTVKSFKPQWQTNGRVKATAVAQSAVSKQESHHD